MALKALNKINGKLKCLYRKDKFLTPTLHRMLCNALIQRYFDYTCSTCYPNLNEKLKKRRQIMQNKRILFCLDWRKDIIYSPSVWISSWLPIYKRVHQCMNITTITLPSSRFLFRKVTWAERSFIHWSLSIEESSRIYEKIF